MGLTDGSNDSYGFGLDFERTIIALCCQRPQFWGRIGKSLDVDLLRDPACRKALEALRAIANDLGRGPSDPLLVIQRMRRFRDEGKMTLEEIRAVGELLEDADDRGLPQEDEVVSEVAPILQRRAQQAAVRKAITAHGKGTDLDEIGQEMIDAGRIGEVDTSQGTRIGPASFEAIRSLRRIQRLPTGIEDLDMQLNGGLARKALGVIVGGAGDGKCLAKGTPVLMYDGTVKAVQSVIVGDTVMGPDSTPRVVLGTNVGRSELFDIVPKRIGDTFRVNLDHVLTVVLSGKRYSNDLVDVPLREWLTWSTRRRNDSKLVHAGAVEFGELPSTSAMPLDPYFLGALLGDGSLKDNLRLTSKDDEIRELVVEECERWGLKIKTYGSKASPTTFSHELTGTMGKKNPVREAVRELGLWGCGAGDKFIPHAYRAAPRSVRLATLAGLLDSDGSSNKSGFEITIKSLRLANDIAFVCRSLGYAATVAPVQKECTNAKGGPKVGTYHRVGIVGDTLYDIPLRLERKRPTPRRQPKNPLRTGFSVAPVGTGDYYGFSLDGDHRFLLGDFTITHNSMGLSHIAAQSLYDGLTVLYATLEIPEGEVLARIKANLTDMSIDSITSGDGEDECIKRLNHLGARKFPTNAHRPGLGLGITKEFSPFTTTHHDIRAWVDNCEQQEGRPVDVLIVDYADRMGAPKESGDYNAQKIVYEGLRNIIDERGIFGWTACQATRSSDKSKIHDLNDMSDSMHKGRIADLVITLNLRGDEGDEMEFYVAKHRTGRSRFKVGPAPHDFAHGMIAMVARDVDRT